MKPRQDVVITRGTTYDNRDNLADSFFTQIVKRYEGTRLGRQELNAEILEDVQGALWTRDLIEETRRDQSALPPMRRIVVGVDPAVSVSETSDETGLIVAGLGVDDHGYVLEDASGKFLPIDWARRAVALYRKWSADRIVAEANQGGLMVQTTIRTVDANVSFKAVHASRGKITRAEPISALFEQRAHLVGVYPELEDQLCTFSAGSPRSPDRMDAMVWALTELMLGVVPGAGWLAFIQGEAEAANAGWMESAEETVRLVAPIGVSHAHLYSGREIIVPPDRIVEMTDSDAGPLFVAGWIRLPASA